jgi:hypothetical protein
MAPILRAKLGTRDEELRKDHLLRPSNLNHRARSRWFRAFNDPETRDRLAQLGYRFQHPWD